MIEAWRAVGDLNSHGTAKFHLDGLLSDAKAVASSLANRQGRTEVIELKLRENVLPTMRRQKG